MVFRWFLVVAALLVPNPPDDPPGRETLELGELSITAGSAMAHTLRGEVKLTGEVVVRHTLGAVKGESLTVSVTRRKAEMSKLEWPVTADRDHGIRATAETGSYDQKSREIELAGVEIARGRSHLVAAKARYRPRERTTLVLDDVQGTWFSDEENPGRPVRTIHFKARRLRAALDVTKQDPVVESVVLVDAELRSEDGYVLRGASIRLDLPR